MQALLHISKESFKFASAHMTVFPDGSKEKIHGHNFTVELQVKLKSADFSKMISFSEFEESLQRVLEVWDEKLLIPERCPFLKGVTRSEMSIEFSLCEKRYLLPRDEVLMLPLENISTEGLATHLLELWVKGLSNQVKSGMVSASLRVNEMPGLGASCEWVPNEA